MFGQKRVIEILKLGGIGVLPTDTLYGLVARAFDKNAVERIYRVRRRDRKKPLIILIASLGELKKFGIVLSQAQKKAISGFWPGKVSAVFECKSKKFEYLHRGKKSLAFRFPDDVELIKILKQTGPLVAPSANRPGDEPATNFKEARAYFTDEVDFYVDGGKLKSKPSTLVLVGKNGEIEMLREGAVKIGQ